MSVFLVLSAVVFSYVLSYGLKERIDSSINDNQASSNKVIQTAGELNSNQETESNEENTAEDQIKETISPIISIKELFGLPINLVQDQIGGSIAQGNELTLDENTYKMMAVADEDDKIFLIEVTFKQLSDCDRYDLERLTSTDQSKFVSALGIEPNSQINYDIRINCQQSLEGSYFKVTVSK